jgi:hypothetical protein
MKLNIPVKVSLKAFHKMIDEAYMAGYPLVEKDGGGSFWIGEVCIGEKIGDDAFIYPLHFARYQD